MSSKGFARMPRVRVTRENFRDVTKGQDSVNVAQSGEADVVFKIERDEMMLKPTLPVPTILMDRFFSLRNAW